CEVTAAVLPDDRFGVGPVEVGSVPQDDERVLARGGQRLAHLLVGDGGQVEGHHAWTALRDRPTRWPSGSPNKAKVRPYWGSRSAARWCDRRAARLDAG